MRFPRQSGVLVHLTALPSEFGIGDMGPSAYHFVEILQKNDQSLWQILPFGVADDNGCPYSSLSAFGGYSLLISPELLVEDERLLTKAEIRPKQKFDTHKTDYQAVMKFKNEIFKKAFLRFKKQATKELQDDYQTFLAQEAAWVYDLTLFQTMTDHFGNDWLQWPIRYRYRDPLSVEEFKSENLQEIEYYQFLQFIFFRQWGKLKLYANQHNIKIIGDIPIFVSHHSMDVWKNPQWYRLNADGDFDVEVGAAPDVFSAVGQKWGKPNYHWFAMKDDGFSWWIARFKHILKNFDIVRLDHFRGFEAVWEINRRDENALNGWWAHTPGHELFETLYSKMGSRPFIAEDLGTITPGVHYLRDRFGLPGMRVLQMAFASGDRDVNLPHNISENSVVYTATHDNDTSRGYFWNLSDTLEKSFVFDYLKVDTLHWINWDLIRYAMYSRADTAIIPIQDVMGLDSSGRFNVPGTIEGNWAWRFTWDQLDSGDMATLREITVDSGRKREVSDYNLSLDRPLQRRRKKSKDMWR